MALKTATGVECSLWTGNVNIVRGAWSGVGQVARETEKLETGEKRDRDKSQRERETETERERQRQRQRDRE